MPIHYRVSADGAFVDSHGEGCLSTEDCIQHDISLVHDEKVKPGFRELVDFVPIKKYEISIEGLRRLAELDASAMDKLSGVRCAIVVPDQFAYRLGQMFAIMAPTGIQIKTFYDFAAARTWLNQYTS